MPDYETERASFSWEAERQGLNGLPQGGLNIAYEAVDRHRAEHDREALRCYDRQEHRESATFGELSTDSNRFANLLESLGVHAGARVVMLLARSYELYVAVLGTLKHRCVVCPLFPAFGPDPIRQRIQLSEASVIVTTAALLRNRIDPLRDQLRTVQHVIVVGDAEKTPNVVRFDSAIKGESGIYEISPTRPDEIALLHFTSGTTGTPKGAVHVHEAVVSHYTTGRLALDLHPGDIFWCTADPGWVTGMSYGIISPLVHGVTSIVDAGEFDARRWYSLLERERVTVWYTSPTALRMLMRAGGTLAKSFDLSSLRFIASVGEPLNPEVVVWGEESLGLPVHDNWWQTETGGIMIANYRSMDIRPGSMGRPLPGIEAAVLRRDGEGDLAFDTDGNAVEAAVGEEGELALRAPWPSMFRNYLGQEQRYRSCFAGDWYRTGDLARVDEDGYFWFVGRGDDVIKSAGHLIGPFEVETVLLEHPAVAEAAVIGKPDPVVGEIVKAFVSLGPGVDPNDELRLDLLGYARKRLGAAVAPREISFVRQLPHTSSGKILRRLLRARELGLPEGDLSTLEHGA